MSDDLEEFDDDDAPPRFSTADIASTLLGVVGTEEDDITRRHSFVEHLARGYGSIHAGLAVGWSEYQIKSVLAEPEMAAIVATINEFKNDTVEYSILRSAQAGNSMAQKMWAHAKMPERGWVEKRTHVIEGQARVDVVHSVKTALMETLREPGAIAALHAASESDIVDGEVVE